MNGKDYVNEAIAKIQELIEELKSSGHQSTASELDALLTSVASLQGLKNKASLRTKALTNVAFQVLDATLKLEEAMEDEEDADIITELCQLFTAKVDTLQASLKERTVIMT